MSSPALMPEILKCCNIELAIARPGPNLQKWRSYTRGRNDLQNYYEGFFSPCEAEDAALLAQGKDDNETGWEKDK